MKKWSEIDNSNKIAVISSILLPTVFFLITIWLNSINQNDIDNLNKKLNAQSFRPLLTIVGDPEITKVWSDPIKKEFNLFEKPPDYDSTTSIIDIPIEMKTSLKVKLKLTNQGTSIAKIYSSIAGTFAGDKTILRSLLLGKKIDKPFKISHDLMKQYTEINLLPHSQDTTTIEINLNIADVKDEKFGIHYLIIYKNELGNMYDSYFQTLAKIEEIFFDSPFKFEGNKIIFSRKQIQKIAISDFIKIKKTRSLYHIYSPEEKNEFENYMSQQEKYLTYKLKVDTLIQNKNIFIKQKKHHWTKNEELVLNYNVINSSSVKIKGELRFLLTLKTHGLDLEFLKIMKNPLESTKDRLEIESFIAKNNNAKFTPRVKAIYNYFSRGHPFKENLKFEPIPKPFSYPERKIAFIKKIKINENDSTNINHTLMIPPNYVGFVYNIVVDNFQP